MIFKNFADWIGFNFIGSGLDSDSTNSQSAHLCNGATLSLARRATEPGHLFHSALIRPSIAVARRLKSRHPVVPAPQHLISSFNNNNIRATQWADYQWNAKWMDNPTRLRIFIPDTGTHTPGMTLPRKAWVRLKRLRTGVGRFRSCLYKWGTASSAACECSAETKPSTMFSSNVLSNPSTSPWTAWPDGSEQ